MPSPANSKSRPIVLPNKAIRTPKIVHKPVATAQTPTTSSSNSLPTTIKTVHLADGAHAVKSIAASSMSNVQKLILPKGNLSGEPYKKIIIEASSAEAFTRLINAGNSNNNNNNCIREDRPLLTGKPIIINARSLDHESCKKELEETKSKLQEFKNMVGKLRSQLEEKDKKLLEITSKNSDLTSKLNTIKEENEDLKKKLEKLQATTGTSSPTTPSSIRKETRSTSNQQSQQNNQNTSPIKTRGVRVQVKNKS